MSGPIQPYRCQYRPTKMSDCARYARYSSRGGYGRAPSSNSTGVSRSAEIARATAARSSASSASVELTKTRSRWSGVRISRGPRRRPSWASTLPDHRRSVHSHFETRGGRVGASLVDVTRVDMTPAVRFGVAHDFRCPPGSRLHAAGRLRPDDRADRAARRARPRRGVVQRAPLRRGRLPARRFAPVAGAAAAVTKRMRISTNISIVPFAHPLRLAEDLAVLDQLSGGRIELGIGLGYAPHEFRGFGFPVSHRVSRTEECVDILRLAWSGERFSYAGKRYQFEDIRVTPDPVQPGGPPLWMAVSSEPGVRPGGALRNECAAPRACRRCWTAGARRPSRQAAIRTRSESASSARSW